MKSCNRTEPVNRWNLWCLLVTCTYKQWHSPVSYPKKMCDDKLKLLYRPSSDVELFMSWTKYLELSIMKSSASELIRNACFNLECLNCLPGPSQAGISILDHLWNGFDSDAELFMCRTQIALIITTYFLSSLNENEYFSPFEFSSAGIKIGVQFSRSKLFVSALSWIRFVLWKDQHLNQTLGASHESDRGGVWCKWGKGPYFSLKLRM